MIAPLAALCFVFVHVGEAQQQSGSQRGLALRMVAQFTSNASLAANRLAVSREAASLPSQGQPFVFFHQRKAGGSSVREMLLSAAKAAGLKTFIACHGVPCETYEPPQAHNLLGDRSVLGAHFYFPAVRKALFVSELRTASVAPARIRFDCLTIFREPVSRVVSCWSYRFRRKSSPSQNPGPIGDTNLTAFRRELREGRSSEGEGCNNEALRILSESGQAEEKINTLTSHSPDANDLSLDDNGWSVDAAGTLYHTLDHMSQCVVGVLERCEDTKRVVAHTFPWLAKHFDCDLKVNKGAKSETIDAAHEAEIKRQNALETLAYDAANRILDAHLELVIKNSGGPRLE